MRAPVSAPRRVRPGERGFVLIAVLWMALGLALGAAGFLDTARRDGLRTRAEIDTARADELATSALNLALADLGRPEGTPETARARRDGSPTVVALPDGTALYRIRDERGKLSLAATPPEILQRLVDALDRPGRDAVDAAGLADRILARRDGLFGDPAPATRLIGEAGGDAATAALLAAHLSPFVFEPRVNPRTAPRAVLEAIPGMTAGDVEAILARRAEGRPLPPLGSPASWLAETEGPVYTIEAEGRVASGVGAAIRAVVVAEDRSFRSGRMRYRVIELRRLR